MRIMSVQGARQEYERMKLKMMRSRLNWKVIKDRMNCRRQVVRDSNEESPRRCSYPE